MSTKLYQHLKTLRQAAVEQKLGAVIGGTCVYQMSNSDTTRRCAIGYLLSPEQLAQVFAAEMNEGHAYDDLVKEGIEVDGLSANDGRVLQILHDQVFTADSPKLPNGRPFSHEEASAVFASWLDKLLNKCWGGWYPELDVSNVFSGGDVYSAFRLHSALASIDYEYSVFEYDRTNGRLGVKLAVRDKVNDELVREAA